MARKKPSEVLEARLREFTLKARRTLEQGYRRFEADMIKTRLSRRGPSSLGRVTGELARSLRRVGPDVQGGSLRIGATIGSENVPYARIHETGGTIRPVNGRALAVPLDRTPAGVSRSKPADWGNLVLVKRKAKPPILLDPISGQAKFVLLTSVTLPPRLHFKDTWEKHSKRMARELFELAQRELRRR